MKTELFSMDSAEGIRILGKPMTRDQRFYLRMMFLVPALLIFGYFAFGGAALVFDVSTAIIQFFGNFAGVWLVLAVAAVLIWLPVRFFWQKLFH